MWALLEMDVTDTVAGRNNTVAMSQAARLNEMTQGGNKGQKNAWGGCKNGSGTSDPPPISVAAPVHHQQAGSNQVGW